CKCLTDASLLKYFPPILKNLKPATLTEIAKIFKVGHLDFSNLWCGEYPCSSCLTSLFGRSDSIYSKDRVGDGLPLVLIEMTSSHLSPYSWVHRCG
ncbi:mCG117600, isoform CRA_b, partial [Mus musculus]